MADTIGVDQSTLSHWERGRPCPDEFKVKLARFYGLPVHHVWLFDSIATPTSSTADLLGGTDDGAA